MADTPIEQSTVFVGSHLKAEAFYGMSGDPNPSSLLPNQKVKRGSVGKSIMRGTDVTVPAGTQTRTVSAKPIKSSPTMKNPNASPVKIPSKVSR
jgi:hypothetical protein